MGTSPDTATATDADTHAATADETSSDRPPGFRPGQVVTVFRSRLRDPQDPEFAELAALVLERARATPGFVDYKVFTAEDGERVSLVTFDGPRSQQAWREDPQHRAAQRAGRERFYAYYSIQVGECGHVHRFDADGSAG